MGISYGFFLGDESTLYDAKTFSEVFYSIIGDGITPKANRMEVKATDSMYVDILPGFCLSKGRYAKLDLKETLEISPSSSYFDRYDAVVFRSYLQSEEAEVLIVTGIAEAYPKKPVPRRDSEVHEIILAQILVGQGSNQITQEEIIDTREDPQLCGFITPLKTVSPAIVNSYEFITSGIDKKVEKLLKESEVLVEGADYLIRKINTALIESEKNRDVGEFETSRNPPIPEWEWLLCDGSTIPPEFPTLRALLGSKLPNLVFPDPRYKTWVYAKEPESNKEV